MKHRYLFIFLFLLVLSGLACGPLSSGEDVTPTSTVVVTPTLAPTATPDVRATLVAAGAVAPTPVGTAGPSGNTAPVGQTGGSQGSTSGGGDTGAAGGGTGNGGDGSSNGGDGGSSSGGQSGGAVACPAGGTNLLGNPSFEGQYKPYGAFQELNHAALWFPWWRDGENNLRPEFKPAEASTAPNRVHSGATAQQYFKSFGMYKAGVSQSVLDVPDGARLQLSAYGQAWSCEEFNLCPGGNSVNPADMFMRVGIDPTGGTDPFSNTIVWSAYFNPLDQWQLSCVEAVADGNIVTVYLWASPNGPRQNQDVYWDDASLVIIP